MRSPRRAHARPGAWLIGARLLILPLTFSVLFACAMQRQRAGPHAAALAEIEHASQTGSADAGGSLPDTWVRGLRPGSEPQLQVHAYNDDFYILRQSKCETFEAPFLYLIFGEERALLMDTGANGRTKVAETVRQVIQSWLLANGRESIPLIVAHTHTHGGHVQADAQFRGQAWVEQVVGLEQEQVEAYWGFEDFPRDARTIDLAGRVLDVLGTPGHQSASVTLYDRRNPIEWVLGCHIEHSGVPGKPYAWGTAIHEREHPLELLPTVLVDILSRVEALGEEPQATIDGSFVIHPVHLVGMTWNG